MSRYRHWILPLLLLLINSPLVAQQSPYLGTAVSLPGTVQAENYDNGGEGIAYHDTTAGNVFNVYRTDSMDVGTIMDGLGGYHVGYLADGEWAEYTVNVTTGGSYNLRLRYSSDYPYATAFRVLLNGADLTGSQSIGATGGWHVFTTKTIPVTLTAGTGKVLKVAFDVGAWNLDWLEFTQTACTPPTITQHPVSATVLPTTNVTFSGAATGNPAPTYQWYRNGSPITGATSSSLTRTNVEQGKDGGSYTVRGTNSCGQATSNAATLRVYCDGPIEGLENIDRALRGLGDYCDWTTEVNTNFPYNFGNGQSYNLPVLAAATAFIKEPVRAGSWNMTTWWTDYLKGELGDRGTVWYYGGQELGSYDYQHYNMGSVLAVHYHAEKTGQTVVRDLARRWLKATFGIHALAAVPVPAKSVHAKGQAQTLISGYTGPYLPVAGMRSPWGFWGSSHRSTMFARAVGFTTNAKGEVTAQKNIRLWVEGNWTNATVNAYGLTSTEQTELRTMVNQGQVPTNFISRFLGTNLRTQVVYRVVAWPGVRVTLMEKNTHGATAPTYGVAFFTSPRVAAGQEAHFLYPWQGLFISGDRRHRHGITQGWGKLDLLNRYIEASNAPGSSTHPLETVRIDNLPIGPYYYHVVLSPTAAPSFQ